MTSGNLQVRARQLWGSDVYTEDSDLVAVLMHTGYYSVVALHPPPSIAEVTTVTEPVFVRNTLVQTHGAFISGNDILIWMNPLCTIASIWSAVPVLQIGLMGGSGLWLQVRAVVQPQPPLQCYTSCSRNSIRSRAWGAKLEGCSYRVCTSPCVDCTREVLSG